MVNPKEQLEEYLDKIVVTVWELNSNLSVIRSLRDLNDPEKRDAYNVLSEFFSFVHRSALTHLVLTIDRLYEEPKQISRLCEHCRNVVSEISYGERSLIWYLTQLKTHSKNFSEPKKISEEVEEQIKWIENESKSIKKIGLYRDKWFAHRDKKYFDNPQKIWAENPLLFEDLENLVNLSNKIVSRSFQRFRDSDISWYSEHLVGLDRVFNLIKSARKTIPRLGEYEIRERKIVEFIRNKCGEEVSKEFVKNYSI